MDGNKDEALRCIRIAEEAIATGNKERALKFIKIALRLNSDLSVGELLTMCERLGSESSTPSRDENVVHKVKREHGSRRSDDGLNGERNYTEEHAQLIREIKGKNDYYAILGVEKTCSVDEIRRAYRKLSLKVHPDKNKAPGSEEAFKKVSKAFKCLSDDGSRRQYDQTGLVEEFEYNQQYNVRRRRRRTTTRDFFNDDIDPDEIFRAFFGEADVFGRGHVYRTRGMGGHQRQEFQDLIGMMKGTSKTSIHAEEKKKKRKRGKIADNGEVLGMEIEEDSSVLVEKKKKKSSNLKRKNKVRNLVEKQRPNVQVDLKEHSDGARENSSGAQLIGDFKEPKENDAGLTSQACKSKKTKKKRKKEAVKEVLNSPANGGVTDEDETYTISSGDEDCSKGMKRWIMEYHQSRPGLQALQDQIDDFITAHEEKLEEERKEREARAAEGGWTVVVHHKGRKKTTDSESGVVVGSVAQAAVEQKAAKKKHKDVALNFYRFQKKEAQRNEIMMLQSKFEEDKKRLQQLRASRKFRPY